MQTQDDNKTIVGGFNLALAYSVQLDNKDKFVIVDEMSVGRSDTCDLKIGDKKISRSHAKFQVVDKELMVVDLNSSNGTFVNGKRVIEATKLKNGDIVKLEAHELKITISADAPNNITHENTSDEVETIEKQEPVPVGNTFAEIKKDVTPASSMTRLHCFSDNAAEQIFELPIANFDEASGWEIGRGANCDIVIEHSSVSNRHAQIIHQRGRWKIVNLVSTNGIVVNGQKKLSAYLDDGDKVGLGSVDLIFKTPENDKANKSLANNGTSKSKNIIVPTLMVLVLIALAAGIYLNINP